MRIVPCVEVFLMLSVEGGELHILLLSHLVHCPVSRIFLSGALSFGIFLGFFFPKFFKKKTFSKFFSNSFF